MPNKTSAPGAQQKRLAAYLDSLARAAGHAERSEPLKGYCRGLLLPLKRKSVEPMAACLAPHNVRRTHQSLHHLVADSPWSDQALLVQVGAWTLPLMKKKNPSASRPATNIAARAVCAIPPARGARYGPSGTIRNRSPRCAARSPTTCYTNSTPAFFAATDARGAGQTAVTVTRRAGGTQLRSFIRDGRDAADTPARPQNILKRLLIHAGAFNLSLLLRKQLGAGTPRSLATAKKAFDSFWEVLRWPFSARRTLLLRLWTRLANGPFQLDSPPRICGPARTV